MQRCYPLHTRNIKLLEANLLNPFTTTLFSTQPLQTNFQKFQIHVTDKLFALWHSAMYI